MLKPKKFTRVFILSMALLSHSTLAHCQLKTHKQLADSYLRQGRPAEAIVEYKEALSTDPSSTAIYFDLAIAYYSVNDVKDAVSALEKLIRLDPRDAEAAYNLGCLKLYQRDIPEAKHYLAKAKLHATPASRLTSLIDEASEFAKNLETLDARTQDAVCLFLLRTHPAMG